MVPNRTRRPPRTLRSRFRVVVTDVDGTLTDRSRRLDPAAVAAVRALEDRGIPVLLATGNVLPVALALHRALGLTGPIVAENGGLLWMGERGRADRVERMADPIVARAAFRALGTGRPARPSALHGPLAGVGGRPRAHRFALPGPTRARGEAGAGGIYRLRDPPDGGGGGQTAHAGARPGSARALPFGCGRAGRRRQ